jgi:hypothetical protein
MEADMHEAAIQRHMPRRRRGHTTSVSIGGERFYLTANGERAGMGIFTFAERMDAAQAWMDAEDALLSPHGAR